jgi:hypothetical protein
LRVSSAKAGAFAYITPSQTAAALNLVQELPLRFDSQPDSDATLQLAREHRLTVYDAALSW